MNPLSFGKFQLLKKLATGGMAEVWLARLSGIEGFQRLLVLKRILPHLADDPEFVQMFLNEAKIAARFNHPNIAQIYDLGEANGSYFIAMEYVHGEDLGRVMRKAWNANQWVAQPLAIRIVASACEGLYYAHTKTDDKGAPLKVVHRDISPQNILISFDGSVKLVDFGIAKAADAQSMTRSGAIKGKFAYMSPEQAGGRQVDQRSDIFSIGLVLYELLTGVRPLKRDSELATLQAALECRIEPPSKVADVPPELDAVVMSAIARSPEDRYRDARAFQMALEEFLVGQRWVATSVQVSELMSALFQDRLTEEARTGYPAPLSDESRSGSAPGTSTQAVQMTWEAPPAAGPVREPEVRGSGVRRAKRTAPPVPDAPGWDAPAATEVPGPRRSSSELRPPEPARRRTTSRPIPAAEGDAPPRRTRTRPSQSNVPAVNRRTGQFSLGVGSGARQSRPGDMPEAPPPVRAVDDDLPEDSIAATSSSLGPDLKRSGGRWGRIAVGAAVVLVLAGAGVVFRESLLRFLTSTANDGAEMTITVDANLPVEVYVEHRADEAHSDRRVFLGRTPLRRVGGVHVRDTIVLENKQRGVLYREELATAQPGENRVIEKEFKTGKVKFRFEPKSLADLSIRLNGQDIARYPGPGFELVEGRHELEVVGPQLKNPAPIQLEVKPGVLNERTFNLASALE